MCKEYSGLGISNLMDLYNSLLVASWLKRYNSDNVMLWKELIVSLYRLTPKDLSI
jgi:hypothetical protein